MCMLTCPHTSLGSSDEPTSNAILIVGKVARDRSRHALLVWRGMAIQHNGVAHFRNNVVNANVGKTIRVKATNVAFPC